MKILKLVRLFAAACLVGMLCLPLAGCGTSVEDEPVGVDDDSAMEEAYEDEDYIAGEKALE